MRPHQGSFFRFFSCFVASLFIFPNKLFPQTGHSCNRCFYSKAIQSHPAGVPNFVHPGNKTWSLSSHTHTRKQAPIGYPASEAEPHGAAPHGVQLGGKLAVHKPVLLTLIAHQKPGKGLRIDWEQDGLPITRQDLKDLFAFPWHQEGTDQGLQQEGQLCLATLRADQVVTGASCDSCMGHGHHLLARLERQAAAPLGVGELQVTFHGDFHAAQGLAAAQGLRKDEQLLSSCLLRVRADAQAKRSPQIAG